MDRIFIIHGHDGASLYRLKDFLTSTLGLDVVILKDEPSAGKTVIENFESVAGTCTHAIALLTPDDKQAGDLEGNSKFRSRQNVILEIGWFMARIGRSNVVLLHKGDVELPSDISGILYKSFKSDIEETFEPLRRELERWGLIW